MIILHTTWSYEKLGLLVWGENCSDEQSDNDFSKILQGEELQNLLEKINFSSDGIINLEWLLPEDLTGHPLLQSDFFKSNELISTLSSRRLNCAYFKPHGAMTFLSSISEELVGGITAGDSTLYWIEATKLVMDLLVRGRVLPDLLRNSQKAKSFWEYRPDKERDTSILSTFTSSMPAVCMAYGDEKAIMQDPAIILDSFLAESINALTRSFLNKFSIQPEVEEGVHLTMKKELYLDWLRSLCNRDGKIEGPAYEIAEFERQIKEWKSHFSSINRPRTPLCFQIDLREPKEEDTWLLSFSIHSMADPRTLLPAGNIWIGELGFLSGSDYSLPEIQEFLLKHIALAADVAPMFKSALEHIAPCSVSINSLEAYEYLKFYSTKLMDLGFDIKNPPWWGDMSDSLGLKLSISSEDSPPSSIGTPDLGLNSLVEFKWEVALGNSGETISTTELLKLFEKGKSLVQINGQWIELNPEKIRETLKFLKLYEKGGTMSLMDTLIAESGGKSELLPLQVVEISSTGWVNDFLQGSTSLKLSSVAVPNGFNGKLRTYQKGGLAWLSFLSSMGIGACLADDMGLGKTIQLLAMVLHEMENGKNKSKNGDRYPVLLFVPMSVINNWEKEVATFAPKMKIYVHHGAERAKGKEFKKLAKNADIVISTYSIAHRDVDLLSKVFWKTIALDEAQSIKNANSKQTKAIKQIAKSQGKLCPNEIIPSRVALTGTPLENHLEELWSIFDFLNPGLLGNLNSFRKHFIIPIEKKREEKVFKKLAVIVKPFILRRLKTDSNVISDLPEKIEIDVFTRLTSEQLMLYKSVLDNMLNKVEISEGIHRKGLVLSTITKLKQICNHPALYLKDGSELSGRSGKVEHLEEILDVVLAEGDKVLIFSQFAQMGALLQTHFAKRYQQDILFLHGGLNKAGRIAAVERFKTDPRSQIFILSLKAGGYGLNLTSATQVVHFDQWWNPATHEQATDRAYRIGQVKNVQVRKFICRGTLEDKIARLLEDKKGLANSIITATQSMITEMNTEELKNFLSISNLQSHEACLNE